MFRNVRVNEQPEIYFFFIFRNKRGIRNLSKINVSRKSEVIAKDSF